MSYDVVFVGSGINSLAGAALLARAGQARASCSSATTTSAARSRPRRSPSPGFTHEVFSSWHPLFMGSAAYAELGDELHARGLEYLNTELATGSLFPDGESIFLTTSHDAQRRGARAPRGRRRRRLGPHRRRVHAERRPRVRRAQDRALVVRPASGSGSKAYRRLGRSGLVEFTGGVLSTCRDWVTETFASPQAHGLLAPWVLHTGLGPEQPRPGS